VEAVLTGSGLHIVNLEVETNHGKVYVGGIILAEEVRELATDAIVKISGVTQVMNHFVVNAPEHYLYGDRR
ncbi:MAG TPA: BON domain-containing protein, partial [Phototrophicaceae bacterium]|nr:BON domain-containing protein [Phototrophicaceae bacterium]